MSDVRLAEKINVVEATIADLCGYANPDLVRQRLVFEAVLADLQALPALADVPHKTVELLKPVLAQIRRANAEEMRERAAKVVRGANYMDTLADIADAIMALQVE